MTGGIGKTHILISALVLAVSVATCAALDIAANSPRVAHWFDQRGSIKARALNRAFVNQGVFGDAFNGLLLVDAPETDFSAGGVYFFGSSNLLFVAQFNDLPPEQRKVIHNFGFPEANPTQIFQLIRYVDQAHGLLSRAPERTHIVLGLSENDLLSDTKGMSFLGSGLHDTGVFTYDPVQGIAPAPMSSWKRALTIRKLRWYDLVQQFKRLGERRPPAQTDVPGFRLELKRFIGTAAPDATTRETAELGRLFDYLKARNVSVSVVRLPKGSWAEGSVLDEAFTRDIPPLCASRGVPILDLSHFLRDDEFMDARHPTFRGAQRERDELVKFALTQLQSSPDHAR